MTLTVGSDAIAGEVEILAAKPGCQTVDEPATAPASTPAPARICSFSVTLHHADEGWDHYANAFEILGPDGEVLATRVLRHPHVDEQPFTRSVGNVAIPSGVSTVRVRARDSVHGYGEALFSVSLEEP